MKHYRNVVIKALVSGLLIVVPVYLAVLLMLKGLRALVALARPLAVLHPPGWPQAADVALALFLLLIVSLAVGLTLLSRRGRASRERLEKAFLMQIPGYGVVRDLTGQLAGQGRGKAWKPALAEMGGGLVLAFIIEDFEDGRLTVFVPSVPAPFRGAVYVLPRERVHPLNASFAQTAHALSRWGSGVRALVAPTEPHRHADEVASRQLKKRAS